MFKLQLKTAQHKRQTTQEHYIEKYFLRYYLSIIEYRGI